MSEESASSAGRNCSNATATAVMISSRYCLSGSSLRCVFGRFQVDVDRIECVSISEATFVPFNTHNAGSSVIDAADDGDAARQRLICDAVC